MKVKFNLVHNRKKKLTDDGKAAIWITARHNGRYKYITTDVFVKACEWDKSSRSINKKANNHKLLNKRLYDKLEFWENLQSKYIFQDKEFNNKVIDDYLNGNKTNSFIEYAEREIGSNNANKSSTMVAHLNALHKFKDFAGSVSFKELTPSLIRRFDEHLRGKGYAQNTIQKIHKNIKIYVRRSILDELLEPTRNPYNHFKTFTVRTTKSSLTLEELKRLEELRFDETEKEMEYVRDMFLFSCYTGLRISDTMKVSSKYLLKTKQGWVINNMLSEKVSKEIYLPLARLFPNGDSLSKPEKIIITYFKDDETPLFNRYASQKVNFLLRQIISDAEIYKDITFHKGRDTFATLMLNVFKVPITIVNKMLQHSKIATTMVYCNVTEQAIDDSLKGIHW